MSARTRNLRTAVFLGCGAAALGLSACGDNADGGKNFDVSQQIGPSPVLPEPHYHDLLTGIKVGKVVGWKEGATPSVAGGLKVTAYAKDAVSPRMVHTLPNGDVLVVQSRGPSTEPTARPKDVIQAWIMSYAHGFATGSEQKKSNMVTLLRDTNRDGVVDERYDLLTDLKSPFGVAWIDGTLYVAATDAILAYPYELGQTTITAAPRVVTQLPGPPIDHHWTKDLVLSQDGRYLYVSVGSNSNITENGIEAERNRAAIWQVDRATGASRIYASGLRNSNGLSFNPETGALWAVVNERDELGPNLVPDYMTSVKENAFYGWPWSYYGNHVDQRVYPQRPDMVQKAIPPDYALSSHVAPLGMTFTMGSAMPAAFANGAFIGEHGSWNRDAFNGYKVIYVPFVNGAPAGKPVDVVTGFLEGDTVHGRPVGVGIDGTGALLIADDAGNVVWRVAAADGSVTPKPVGTDRVASVGGAQSGYGEIVPNANPSGTGAPAAGASTAGASGSGAATNGTPSTTAPSNPASSGNPATLPDGTVPQEAVPSGQ